MTRKSTYSFVPVLVAVALVGVLASQGRAEPPADAGWANWTKRPGEIVRTGDIAKPTPAQESQLGGIFIFFDKIEFEQFVVQQGKELKGVEDFEPPVSNLLGPDIAVLADPLLGGVPNIDPGNGLGFPNGLLNNNISIQSNTFTENPPIISPGAGMVALGPGFIAPGVPNSVKIGSALFAESLDVIFDPADAPTGVGLTVEDPISGLAHISVFDLQNVEIFRELFTVPMDGTKFFFGIWTPQPIGRINVGGPGGELVDNIQKWQAGPPAEACCLPDGTCLDLTLADCASNNGTPQGAGTDCGTTTCPQPPCTVFDNQTDFELFNLRDGKQLKGVEDFEHGVIPPGTFADLTDPMLGNVPNIDPASGLGFPTGLINVNLAIQSNSLGSGAPMISPGAGLRGLGQGFLIPGPPPVPNSIKVGTRYPQAGLPGVLEDSLDLIFDPDSMKTGVGFDVIDPTVPPRIVTVTVFDLNNQVIFSGAIPNVLNEKVFFGIWCEDGIGRINLAGESGPGANDGAEYVDNIQLWDEPDCPGEGNCFLPHPTPGCNDAGCCESVCAIDPFCCQQQWDQLCADEGQQLCGNAACGDGGSCFIVHPTPGCNNGPCCKTVCLIDPFCCEQEWDALCVDEANQLCEGCLADTNLDNEVNVNDLVNVIVLWSTDGNAPGIKADINKDGVVDVNDLVLVIVNWGPCP